MPSQTKAKPKHDEPRYVEWRGILIAKLALTRAGLAVQDPVPPQPFDILASTHDGFYFLIEVGAYSSLHGKRQPVSDPSGQELRWPVESALLLAAAEVNLPVVLFVIDADRETGHYARLDRLPSLDRNKRITSVPIAANRDLGPQSLAALLAELRRDWAVSRRPA